VGKNSGPILSRLWTKVHEILRRRFQRTCPIIYHVSFRRCRSNCRWVAKSSKNVVWKPPIC